MPNYHIQQRIATLAQNAVMEGVNPPSFEIEKIKFEHWDFSFIDGWLSDAWIAKAEIEANTVIDAYNIFFRKLHKIIPRIALISQTYIEYINETFLISKDGTDLCYFRYTDSSKGVGLMFMEPEHKALQLLIKEVSIPDEFYYYWNDAVNSYGYSSKLLLMFSSLESLFNTPNYIKPNGEKDWDKIENLLGKQLKEDLYGTRTNSRTGLRHRLTHGEYFSVNDTTTNYLELVHNKILNYFNNEILKSPLLHTNIVNPQRHIFGNIIQLQTYVTSLDPSKDIDLKEISKDYKNNDNKPTKFKEVFPSPNNF